MNYENAFIVLAVFSAIFGILAIMILDMLGRRDKWFLLPTFLWFVATTAGFMAGLLS